MVKLFSNKDRVAHASDFPLENLPRGQVNRYPGIDDASLAIENPNDPLSLRNALREYINIMDRMRAGPVVPKKAPIPADPKSRSDHLKAACYYLDATMAGTCRVPRSAILPKPVVNRALQEAAEKEYGTGSAENVMAEASVKEGQQAWSRAQQDDAELSHKYALVILTEFPRDPRPSEPGAAWIKDMQAQRAAIRGAEVGAMIANYLRFLGYDSRMHTPTARDIDLNHLAIECGLAVLDASNAKDELKNPFIGSNFGLIAITTDLELSEDGPLANNAVSKGRNFSWWMGFGGTRPGFAGQPFNKRDFCLGPYPMETIKRVEEPTTLIDADNIPRSPKRHDMFIRAAMGDLGAKAQKELDGFRMITKNPFGHAMIPVLGGMVPLQYGEESSTVDPSTNDPQANADAVKAALYYLGADMVGICEVPDYAWYSHDVDGSEIKPYHKYAISILIDQGYDTMEGGSGDDWISGAQSMRAYSRAQLLGGIVGSHIRNLGYSARGHSVIDQDVLHIPLILNSGLGELSRIGELVLNPFVGPRFKSGIITTNMPLAVDKPIDFGLQDFCTKCTKCARECPVAAIPFGEKIMFNGYEMWKPDVEKCARYRITNASGSMCGRCMKTCPYNLEGVLKEKPFLWAARNLPFTRKAIADLDDKVGNGRINPLKRWWWNLDTNDEGEVVEAAKANERQLVFRPPLTAEQQKLGCYPSDSAPPPVSENPIPPDRKEAYKRYQAAEKPAEYRVKLQNRT